MPIIKSSIPVSGGPFRGHIQTIIPALTRSTAPVYQHYWELQTPDGDLLELASTGKANSRAVLLSHGLEGSAYTPYMMGMARFLSTKGYDVYVWNFRGCGKKINPGTWYYHSGKTEDLKHVVQHLLSAGTIQELYLVGFSIGGNLTLKYLGEENKAIPPAIKSAVCISAPLELKDCALHLGTGANRIYLNRFLRSLKKKLQDKEAQHPGSINLKDLHLVRDFIQFDGRYTAPHSGFRDADDYYRQSSSLYYIPNIQVPTLLLNAYNDPFLSESSYPVKLAGEHRYLHLETPEGGGHVGFRDGLFSGEYHSERRVFEFISANH